jgi:integrase
VLRGSRGWRQQAEAAAAFGWRDARGHDLRRTAATLMRKAGVPQRQSVSVCQWQA